MNLKPVISTLLAISLTTGGVSFAQENRDHRNGGRNEQAQPGGPNERHDNVRREANRPGNDRRHDERGAGPGHAFYRGDRLPDEYRHNHYVVDDWRAHHLSAPPRGYHWVQTGGDYVLVAITTGIILNLLLNN